MQVIKHLDKADKDWFVRTKMGKKRTSSALLSLVIILLHSHLAYCLKLPDYQKNMFTNPSGNPEFTKLTVHNETGDIYIGGGNVLYRLAADYLKQESVNTKVDCIEDECPVNYNKILLVDYVADILITCGSEKDGSCQTRALDNIAILVREDDTPVATSGKLSTEAIIAPGPENGGVNTLYVAATYEEDRYNARVYPVCRRTLSASTDTDLIFNIERNANILLDQNKFSGEEFIINYISAFVKETHDNAQTFHYTYFVTTQRQDLDEHNKFDKNYFSKINRVCQDTSKEFNSYAEILLDCQGTSQSDHYNLIQAAHVGPASHNLAQSLGLNDGDDVFYGVFAKQQGVDGNIPSNQTALCVYKLEDIEEKFIDGIYGCLKDGGDFHLSYLQFSDCPGVERTTRDQAVAQQCSASNWAYADGYNPLASTAALQWTDILPSSIVTAIHRNHTIAYVGTAEGDLVKVHLESGTHGREYERFPLGSHVLRDALVDEAQEMVTILTEQKLLKLKVENCGAYTTCDDCIGVNGAEDGDPYCGWCTLEKKCTRHDACPMADESTRWLPYNSVQCVSISSVSPYDSQPITQPSHKITLTVEQLPHLRDDSFYECIFDNAMESRAEVNGNTLTCYTPMISEVPKIPQGSDHVTMQLNVYSTETNMKFVSTDYHFYECQTHKMCVACTSTRWACDWCIYSNKCTHDSSTCSDDESNSVIDGENHCPQLAEQTEAVLISVGVNRPITVSVLNLPNNDKVGSFRCILTVEGKEQMTDAVRNQDNINCQEKTYTYSEEVHMLNVSVSVTWNGDRKLDDVNGCHVILYKCEVGRPDCSRCLTNLITKPELGCGWCKNEFCSVEDNPRCTSGWMPSTTNSNCPNPVLSKVWPTSGPYEGNTIIAVSGTDLGQKFSDVHSVTINGMECSTEGLEDHYIPGESVSCRTLKDEIDVEREIAVTVSGSDGNRQGSSGQVKFTYRNPSISNFEPIEGPADGGTQVVISGTHLNAGYNITARIGSDCTVVRNTVTAEKAMCRTTSNIAEMSHQLEMSFDGATRQSDSMFTYKPNPQVTNVQPRKSIRSGGREIKITGNMLRLAQTPEMIVYLGTQTFKDSCNVQNDIMLCKTPSVVTSYQETNEKPSRRKRVSGKPTKLEFGFIVGEVESLLRWSKTNNATLDYYDDPSYDRFKADPETYNGSILILTGHGLDFASSEEDVMVYVGPVAAHVQSLDEKTLTCKIPDKNPGPGDFAGNKTDQELPYVTVRHGNLNFVIGRLQYPEEPLPLEIYIIASICGLLVLMLIIAAFVLRNRIKSHEAETNKLLIEMQNLETSIADDIRSAFAQLQTDVTDLTSDLEGTGMPFVSHRQYAMSMFFYGLDILPSSCDQENCDDAVEQAMVEFSKLLNNKTFLLAYIQTLDEDKKIPIKDKQNIASLLMVLMILEDKLAYLTDVMITLMSQHVQEVVEDDRPRQLFQRTETIVEKLLTNWIALSLYDFLKDHTAYPLFLLYRAIKCQSEKGPIDVITGRAHYSLSDENVLSNDVVFEELTLQVVVNDEDGEKKEVRALDVDTVSQVKEKILDSIYRNRPYSTRQNAQQVDLEWRHGQSGHLVLQDVDVSSDSEPGWKKINTLSHFSVPDSSRMALVVKQTLPNAVVADTVLTGASNYPHHELDEKHSLLQRPYNLVDYQAEDGIQLWHLAKEHEGGIDELPSKKNKDKAANIVARGKKHIREINFPRLLATKGTVQEYVDQMFDAILNTQDVPLGIKYIFDFFDGQARRYDVMDSDVLHKWKSNTLPLRFWQNIITHPNYIFDVRESRCAEASLRVVSQAFFDAFSKSDHKLGKNAPFNKLLYNREMPKYREMVDTYYSSVSNMEKVSKSALDVELTAICQKFTGLFSRLSTLSRLYEMTQPYKRQLEEALEEDEQCQRYHLAEKLEEISGILDEETSSIEYRIQ